MGKVRRLRRKYHAASKTEVQPPQPPLEKHTPSLRPLSIPSDDLFASVNINFEDLKTRLSDDTEDVKSQKSVSSKVSRLPKKDKLKMRREMFLKKMDAIKQAKQELKQRKKAPVIGDTKALRDALPSLENLFKERPNVKYSIVEPKNKGIQKSKVRRKELVQGVKTFKAILRNKAFKKDPMKALFEHIQAMKY
ncbi:ribosome biogenesis protein SLX9 homolog [Euwallacea fornicatus]|uniref:ribosome biogenesis protein SLX9 homolog n=1 Tax=Euwallacea fornicatus TaxID=995702 RepID=UPI00338F56CE